MENIQNALSSEGLQNLQIKVSTSISAGLLSVSYPPSFGSFSNEAKPFIRPIINLLNQNNAPLLVNVYPYFSYIGDPDHISLDYALFRSRGVVIQDGPFGYRNIFDAILDAHYAALEKEGGSNVNIIVSETGWPSAGNINHPVASVKNAGTYYRNVNIGDLNHISLYYELFRSRGVVVQDGPLGYRSRFDVMLDAHHAALQKEGGSNVNIVVSETGWPSAGNIDHPVASVENAGTYYRNVIDHVKSEQGTPRRPGRSVETYLFAMFDENQKPGDETERHFGLFFPNQQPKYGISFK